MNCFVKNKFMQKLVYFLLAFLLNTNVLAECPHTFICTQQGCAKVTETSCSIPEPLISNQLIGKESVELNSQGATFVSPAPNNKQSSGSNPKYVPPSIGCAENGSCYGDTSVINGLPKTTHVDGYFRKDGTYVRGHYRSKGR
jgi:hypothetical protein